MAGGLKDRIGMFVLPGDEVGIIEEFRGGKGTYVEGGVIRSRVIGSLLINPKTRKAFVYPRVRIPTFPRRGKRVLAEVLEVKKNTAIVNIVEVGGTPLKTDFLGVLHLPEGWKDGDPVAVGDLVRARIVNTRNGAIQLLIDRPNLGVVYSFCPKCGEAMRKAGSVLRCPACGNVEKRKVAVNYGVRV